MNLGFFVYLKKMREKKLVRFVSEGNRIYVDKTYVRENKIDKEALI